MKVTDILPKSGSEWTFVGITAALFLVSYVAVGAASPGGKGFALILIGVGIIAGNLLQVQQFFETKRQLFFGYAGAMGGFLFALTLSLASIATFIPESEFEKTELKLPEFPPDFPDDADNCTPFVLPDPSGNIGSGEGVEFVIVMPAHVGDYFEITDCVFQVQGETVANGLTIPKGGPWVEVMSFTPQGDPRREFGESNLKISWDPLAYANIRKLFNKPLDLELNFELSYAAPIKGKEAYRKSKRSYRETIKLLLVSDDQKQIFAARSKARKDAINKVKAANATRLSTTLLVMSALVYVAACMLLAMSLPIIPVQHLIWSGEIFRRRN